MARLLAFVCAATLTFASLDAEGQETPYPKLSAGEIVALASDPNLWDRMAAFQSAYPGTDACPSCTYRYCPRLAVLIPCYCAPIYCGDTDPCTDDSCDKRTGTCVHAPNTGSTCDDRNACTLDDQCQAGACTGTPILCDDGNVCTLDRCDSVLGCRTSPNSCDDGSICTTDSCDPAMGCLHAGLPGEAGPLVFTDQATLVWNPALGASFYNTYRGSIPARGLSGRAPLYDHACFESGDAQLNGPQLSVDREGPAFGTSFYYLVDGESAFCGEGPIGTATDGTPQMPIAFCPTPP